MKHVRFATEYIISGELFRRIEVKHYSVPSGPFLDRYTSIMLVGLGRRLIIDIRTAHHERNYRSRQTSAHP